MPSTIARFFGAVAKPFTIDRLVRPLPPRPQLASRRAASDSQIDYSDMRSLNRAAKAQTPAALAAPAHGPTLAHTPLADGAEAVAASVTEMQVQDLEMLVVREMGPWAVHGLRYSTFVAAAVATVVSILFAVVPLAIPIMPGVGIILFAGVLLGGIAIGAAVQALARRAWRRRTGGPEPLLQQVALLRLALERKETLTRIEISQLRRLQVLENDIRGGFKQAVWSVVYGVSGFDPALRSMMSRASDKPTTQPRRWGLRIPLVRPTGFWRQTNLYSANPAPSLASQMLAAEAVLPAPKPRAKPSAARFWLRRPTWRPSATGAAAEK